MKQNINKVNATTRDYRGNKTVLKQRVIEGVDSTIYDLTINNLQLNEDTPKTIIINEVNNGKIYLPNAQNLISGWKITIINNSDVNNCQIFYYDSEQLFTEIAPSRMTEILFLGLQDDNDEQGNWKVVILSELTVTNNDKYITNKYVTKEILYSDLGDSYTKNIELVKIDKSLPVKSIYINSIEEFTNENDDITINLNIGTIEDFTHFYNDLPISNSLISQRDLFDEIINIDNNDFIIANFTIPNVISNNWTNITSNITNDIKQIYYGANQYAIQTNNSIFFTDVNTTLSDNMIFAKINIDNTLFSGLKSYSDYSLQYKQALNEYLYSEYYFFYINNDDKLTYYEGQNIDTMSIGLSGNDNIDSIQYITKIYTNDDEKWFISCIYDTNKVGIIYIDNLELTNTWSLFPLQYNNSFISDINSISTSIDTLVINTNTASYYSIDNGATLQLLESYTTNQYRYKYFAESNIWMRIPYNNTDNILKYVNNSSINENTIWQSKSLLSLNNITNINDIKYINNIWYIIRFYQNLESDHQDLLMSTDFFDSILPINNPFNDNIVDVCGSGINGFLMCNNDNLAYTLATKNFSTLNQGKLNITIEYASSVDSVSLQSPIIQGQIMPLGTVINYPFKTLPAGYARMDGQLLIDVQNTYPNFWKLLQANPQLIDNSTNYKNEVDYKAAVDANNGNFPKFCWANAQQTNIRMPIVNCFVRGYANYQQDHSSGTILSNNYVNYFNDGLPNITGTYKNGYNDSTSYPTYTSEATGAFRALANGTVMQRGENRSSYPLGLSLDASRSNSIYGNYSNSSDNALKNKVIPAHITFPYIMAIYHVAQDIGKYNLDNLGELLQQTEAQLEIAMQIINDLNRNNELPVATILPYSGNQLPNINDDIIWAWCDGAALNSIDYPKIYNIIGTTYGTGDGTIETDFSLPNISDSRFIEGYNVNANEKIDAGLPNITGSWREDSNSWTGSSGAIYDAGNSSTSGSADGGGSSKEFRFDASRSSSIYKNDVTTVQPKSIRMRYIIKIR